MRSGTPLRPGVFQRVAAALYDRATAELEREVLGAHRRRLLQNAYGNVLDVGAGTGANLPHYPPSVERIVLLDPDAGMLARAAVRAGAFGERASVHLGSAEQLPIDERSFDCVVFTLSLCTVKDVPAALSEAARALRPTGRLLILEHVRSRDPRLARWQDRLAPFQRLLAGGCNPNRDTLKALRHAGFEVDGLEEFDELRMPYAIVRPLVLGSARFGSGEVHG